MIPSCRLKAASVPAKCIEEINDDLLRVRVGRIAVTSMEHLLLLSLGKEISNIGYEAVLGHL